MTIEVAAEYAAIGAVTDICEAWIDEWGGDEWGDSMRCLQGACRTSHGFSDEDCALFASKLFENLMSQKAWMDKEGQQYGLNSPQIERLAQMNASDVRDYWLEGGGNLKDEHSKQAAKAVIDQMPSWLFG